MPDSVDSEALPLFSETVSWEEAQAALEADEQMHELILEACPNRVLAETARRLRYQCRAFRAIRALTTEKETPYHERLAILRAIRDGQPEEAGRLLSAHIRQGATTSQNQP